MLILEWAGPGSCETRFSWFAIDYRGRLAAIGGADDAARQLLTAETLPGQAGKTFPLWGVLGTGTWILSLGKMEIKKVPWGFSNREEKYKSDSICYARKTKQDI